MQVKLKMETGREKLSCHEKGAKAKAKKRTQPKLKGINYKYALYLILQVNLELL